MPGARSSAVLAPLLPALTLAVAAAGPAAAGDDAAAILGVWRGTSTCTNREIAPACKDERVIYTFVPIAGAPATRVRQEADKLVGVQRERMGEIDFAYDAATGVWSSEFRNARFHGIWSLTVALERITGTLVDVPSKAVVRRIEVTRDAQAGS